MKLFLMPMRAGRPLRSDRLLPSGPPHGRPSDGSGAAEKGDSAPQGDLPEKTDGHLIPVDNHRHLLPAPRKGEHLLEFLGVLIHVHIDGTLPIGRPGLVREGSGIRPVDDDFFCHDAIPPFSSSYSCPPTVASVGEGKVAFRYINLPPPKRTGTPAGRRLVWS